MLILWKLSLSYLINPAIRLTKGDDMASNLLELRKAAGYRNAGDFAEAHGIPTSTYTRYESNPNKIPLDRAWQLADFLNSTIDVIVGREAPSPSCSRGNVAV